MIVLRTLVRVVTFLLLALLALLSLAVALSAIAPSGVAELVRLPELRDTVGSWFDALAAPGPTAKASALGGVAAIVLGLLLLLGLLVPRRERLVTLTRTRHGALGARRRVLAQVATALVEQTRGVTEAKVKVKPRRGRAGGRLRVRAARPRREPAREVERAIAAELGSLTGPFKLKASVHARSAERGARVQ